MGLEVDFSKLSSRFDRMAKKMQNSALDKALDAGKKPVIEAMERNVLVDTSELKGNLGELKKQGSGTGRKSIIGITSEKRNVIERGYYAEYGTECQAASHWMKKSFDESKGEAKDKIINTLKEELDL